MKKGKTKVAIMFLVTCLAFMLCGCMRQKEDVAEEEYVVIRDEIASSTTTIETDEVAATEAEPFTFESSTERSIVSTETNTVATSQTTILTTAQSSNSQKKSDVTSATAASTTTVTTMVTTGEKEEILENPPFECIPTEPDTGLYYEVKSGDSWKYIASIYLINPDYLARFNGKETSDILYPGDILFIPDEFIPVNQMDEEEISTPDYSVLANGTDSDVHSDGIVNYGSDTKVSPSAAPSSFTNMEIAAGVLNDTVSYIPPGGTFSWLDDVGPCTSKPYVLATAYNSGKVTKAYGGGICMLASALKVAAWKSGCVITETHPHSLPVPYNPRENNPDWRAYESTIDASGQDLKFYNPSKTTGLTISAYVDTNKHTCTVELIPDFTD